MLRIAEVIAQCVLLQPLSLASGARPAKLYASGAGRALIRRGVRSAALVGAGRITLHACTVPVAHQIRYPLSAGAKYNLSGEITKVTSSLRSVQHAGIP